MKNNYSLIAKVIFTLALMSISATAVFAQTVQNFPATGSWTCPAGVTKITVECWGSGGAGGGANTSSGNTGGGGGGGAFARKLVTVVPSTNYTVTVGAAVTATTGAGANGNPSWFNTAGTVYAIGGTGGGTGASGTGGAGGAGGSCIGDVVYSGGNGANGSSASYGGGGGGGAGTNGAGGNTVTSTGGIGATVNGGNGGGGGTASNTPGNIGNNYGGGGGGARRGNTNQNGGGSAPGYLRLTWSTITSLTPASACSGSGASVVITGTGFTGATLVTFNGTPSVYVVNSSTQITATLPGGATTGVIQVTTPGSVCNSLTNFTVNPVIPVSVTISSSHLDASGLNDTICSGDNVTFTATGTNPGSSPIYTWYKNSVAVATGNPWVTNTLVPGDLIYCELTSNVTCPSAVPSLPSNNISVIAVPSPSTPSTVTGLSTVCINQTGVSYSVTSVSSVSTYFWTCTGGTIMSGQGTNAITVNWGSTPAAANPTAITVVARNRCLTSSSARNKSVAINNYSTPPTLTIIDAAAGPTTICQYASINFSANISEATLSKVAVWKVDGVPNFTSAPNTNPAFFTYPNPGSFSYGFPVPGAHTITCEITFTGQPAPSLCYSPNISISNSINYSVTQNEPPQVTIADVANGNPICRGTLDVFTATPFDAGTPTYTWYVDGIPDGSSTSAIFNYIHLTAGVHVVYCIVHSSQACDNAPPSILPDAYSLNTVIVNVDPCSYYVPVTGNLGPYNACGGSFYDSQLDPGANYTNNQNGTVTFCAALAGQFVSITFTSMALADNTDILRLYSGTGTGGPLLQTFQGPVNTTSFCGAVVSQDVTGGCITAQFQTGSSGIAAGWEGNIACSPTSSVTPAGASCTNPTIISALPYTATGHTTQCFINDYTNQSGICNASYNGEDHVYQYISTGPECTSISMSGTTNNPALAVYQGCPGAGGICLTSTPMVGNNTMQFTFPSAGTYYIIVDEASGYSDYTLSIQSFGLAPANDLPCNAQYIDLAVNVNGNNSCTGSATEPGNASCWTTGTLNTTWYSFISPASPNPSAVKIRTTPGTIGSTQIALYSGTCSSLTQIACNQAGPNCATTPTPPSSEIIYSNLTPNTMYYIRVDGRNNTTGNYSIVVADVNGVQPYADGQDCVVPMTICNSVFTVGDPGFLWTGWVCDFGVSNTSCMSAGERSSAWYVFTTNGTGNISWRLTPNGTTYVDYDWILMDITSFGGDQASRIAAACPQINAGTIPWVRCNISDVILFAPCATSQYMTGMCPSSTVVSTTAFGPSFCSSLAVNSGQTFLLHLSNWTQNAKGFTIDFNAFGVSPIAYSNPPSVLYWTGGANNTDWFNTTNWGNCGPPDCNTNAIITTGSTYMPSIVNGQTAQCRGLDIKAGASVTMVGNAQLDICGNFVNNGSLIAASTSVVNCISSSAQYFDGNMIGSSSFGNLKMSKSAAGNSKMTLLDNAQMTGTLTLANTAFGGKIVTGVKELYITNNAPSSSNFGNATSYVEGNLRRNLNGTLSSGTYYFPLGHATPGWQLATIDFTSTHSIPNMLGYFSTWGVLPGPTNFTDGGACPITYNTAPGFYDNGYWTLTASANASSANYDLQVRNALVTNGPGSNWTVAKAATTAGPWSLSGACTGVSYPFAKRTGMNGFSVFATAQTSVLLPISLLNFDAVAKGTEVMTSWVTESETNNDYFVIERSSDGEHFEPIGSRKGAGNSSGTLYYSMLDPSPLNGVSYYRLSQVDFDGKTSKSEMVAVSFDNNNVLNVFPNPAQTEIQYRFISAADGIIAVEMMDALGKVVYSEQVNVQKGLNVSDPVRISNLPQGVYFIQLKALNSEIIEPMQKRFVKQTQEE